MLGHSAEYLLAIALQSIPGVSSPFHNIMNTTTYFIIFLFDMVLVLAEFEDYNDSQNIIGIF